MTHEPLEDTPSPTPALARRGLLGAAGITAALAGAAFAGTRPAHADEGSPAEAVATRVTLADLRAMTETPTEEFFFVTDPGMEGLFRHDAADSDSADNTGTVLVSAGGARFARVFSGPVNVRWFGARGDGETDDAAAIQAAISAVRRVAGVVYLPQGAYAIAAPLDLPTGGPGFRIMGDTFAHGTAAQGTTIMPHESVTESEPLEAIFRTTTDGRVDFLELDHLSLVGDNRVNYGIHLPQLVAGTVTRVSVRSMLLDGMAFGRGWYNRIDNCRFFSNGRDGVRTIASEINAVTVTNTIFLRNGHAGINIDKAGAGIQISGCSIEGNRATGILVQGGSRNIRITDCYFETNVTDGPGYSFSNPERTIRAEVIINGTGVPEAIGSEWPTGPVVLDNNYVAWAAQHVDEFVAAFGVHTGLQITNTTILATSGVTDSSGTLLRTGTTKTGLGALTEKVALARNDVQYDRRSRLVLHPLQVDDLAGGLTKLHDADLDDVERMNYAPPIANFTNVQSGASGALRPTRKTYRRAEIRELTSPRQGASHVFGFDLDLDDHPELAGEYVYFACYAKVSGDNMGPVLWTSQLGDNTAEFGESTDWAVVSYVDRLPETGVVSFGIRNLSSARGASISYAKPVLAMVGAPFSTLTAS